MGLKLNFEDKIIANILFDRDYANKVIPYTKPDYFDQEYKHIISVIIKFFNQYSTIPTIDEIKIELTRVKGISDNQLNKCNLLLDQYCVDNSDRQWLVDKTEKFYQERSLTHAIITGAGILEKQQDNTSEILKLVQDALAVNFDSSLGHDYFNDYQKRYDSYHKVEDKVSWGIRSLDEVTGGGISKKNLACVIAPTGKGKSAMLVNTAANAVRNGQNVLYISMEMSEERVAERIDANLTNHTITSIHHMSLQQYTSNIKALQEKSYGRLIIKEYPTSGANTNHFKTLMNELKLKQAFVPDLVVVDYMNICNSARVKSNGVIGSYGIIKAISEELRGIAVEYNVAVLTATQTNRQGMNNSDIVMEDTSESIGSVFVLDFFCALIRTEALDEAGQVMIKQLKNRYCDLNIRPTIQLNFDRDRMRIYDIDEDMNDPCVYQPKRQITQRDTQKRNNDFTKPVSPKNDFSNFSF